MKKALEGIRVLDLSSHLSGPFCTMQLGDLGAEVIKIEPPSGDHSRLNVTSAHTKGQAPYFLSANRNKKDIMLNLKTKEALEIFYKLASLSDVIVENYRPGIAQKLGVDYESVNKINPKIVYASITGFGQTGPYRSRPSFDVIAQAMGGMMHLSGWGGPPVRTAGSIGDTIPALYAAIAILGALHYARSTGKGQYIDVSQVHSITACMPILVQNYLITKEEAEGAELKFPMQTLRGIYKTKDGYITIAALYQFMDTLVKIIGREVPEISNEWIENMALSREGYDKIINWLKNKTNEELETILQENIPYGPVLKLSEIVDDPQAIEREMFVDVEHTLGFTYKMISSPMKLTETPTILERVPPTIGQDTDEILSKLLGYSEEEIAELKKAQAI